MFKKWINKQTIVMFLVGVFFFSGVSYAAELIINPNPFPVIINGIETPVEGYNINGYTYLKLADFKKAGLTVKFNQTDKLIEITNVVNTPTSNVSENTSETSSEQTGEATTTEDTKTLISHPEVEINYYGMPVFRNNPPLIEQKDNLYCFTYDNIEYVLLDLTDRPKSCPYKYKGGVLSLTKNEIINDEAITTILIPQIPHGECFWNSYRFAVPYDYYINTLLPILKGAE